PKDAKGRAAALQWLMFACTDAAPASSGIFYVGRLPDPPAAAVKMFEDKLLAHFAVADARAKEDGWLAGKEITVADIALYPVVQGRQALLDKAPGLAALKDWARKMADRPSVKKTFAALPVA
ncbi:MAG: glutathione S-transferase family protein, partial [Alphaproteobacteria bacterium]|nr:glutathione S-transferase family protein [Alphaproteobacteria bacterium]